LFGVLLWGGLHWALERVNNEKFCISCHEMGENNYAELQETIHFKNRSGVRATCPDCHVPKQWLPKMIAKIKASADVYRHVMGRYNTPEKFEEKRARLAQNVWKSMKEKRLPGVPELPFGGLDGSAQAVRGIRGHDARTEERSNLHRLPHGRRPLPAEIQSVPAKVAPVG
jgi:cytochrome c-type protein NapC